ncbi:MAG TPA: autotransporter domain-containing protein [Steroidobacteraceae bacterium]|nr:autotransporter domain-containing protein [Steroidobacteraceae bacterium]
MAMQVGNRNWLARADRRTVRAAYLPSFAAIAFAIALLSAPGIAQAQAIWGGAGSTTTTTDYNLGTNWSTGVVPVNSGAAFDGAGSPIIDVTVGANTPDYWSIGAGNYTISGQAVNFNGTGVAGYNLVNASGTNSISNNLTGTGGIEVASGLLTLSGNNTFANAAVFGGTLKAGSTTAFGSNIAMTVGAGGTPATLDLGGFNTTIGSLSGNATGVVTNSGGAAAVLTTGGANTSTAFAGTIQDGASATGLTMSGTGTLTLSGNNTYTGNTTIAAGTLALSGNGSIAASALVTINLGGILDISQTNSGTSLVGLAGAAGSSVILGANTLTITSPSPLNTFSGVIGGTGGLTVTGGVLELAGSNAYTGVTTINNGASLNLQGIGSIAASSRVVNNGDLDFSVTSTDSFIRSLAGTNTNANVFLGANLNLTITNANDTFAGKIQDAGNLILASGNQTLTGANSYTGTTTVNGGTLRVDGTIASSSMTTVNATGTLAGVGTVGNLTVNGGTFAPGDGTPAASMNVAGSLTFTAAATYLVQVNPTTASFATATGTATLGGATVNAVFASGSYVAKQYTILTAGSRAGTFNSTVLNTNLPSGFKSSLSYDATRAYLNLALSFAPPPGTGLSGNQQNVGNSITNFFNSSGSIPLVFGSLTPAGLTQLSGESATASQQTTFDAMSQFMGLMTDPFVAGRGDPISAGGAPNGYAEESLAYAARGRTASERDAYAAMYTKAVPATPFEQRWSVWAAGYGGSQKTNGDPAVQGSNDTRSSIYGTAVGADYHFSPDTIAGFALAGGGTNFSVNTLGSGRSDLFQAGAFVRHNVGPAYITGALAYAWQDVTTNRTVTVAGLDQLRAEFNANAWSGRVESGYRFVAPVAGGVGITPYAAGQFTTFELPSYMEQAVVGSNQFALAYNSKSVTDTRSELGFRTDKSFAAEGGIFTLRGRLAWAHDFNPDRALLATFQTLPGASFVVNGATQSADSALTSASAEWKWTNGWSAAATFEGEFSSVTQSYAGKGVVRYAW